METLKVVTEKNEVIKEISDLRQEGEKVIIRFDPRNISILTINNGKKFNLIKKIEIQDKDGSWKPYPNIKCFCNGDKFFTEALIMSGEEENAKLVLKTIEP